MTALLAALSLQDKAEQYGAYAGIAAVFGLGVLSLLYFAQAREVKRLREWAGRAPERAAELEALVTATAEERRIGPAEPAAQPAGAVAAAAAGNGAGAPAAVPAPDAALGPVVPVPGVPASAPGEPARAPGVPSSLPAAATAAATAAGARAAAAATAPGGPGAGVPASAGGATATLEPPPIAAPASGDGRASGDGPAAPGATIGDEPAPVTAIPDAPDDDDAERPASAPPAATPAAAGVTAASAGQPPPPATPGSPKAAAPMRAPVPQATLPPRTAAGAARARAGAGRGGAPRRSRRTLVGVLAAIGAMVVIAVVLGVTLLGGDNGGQQATPRPNTVAPPASATTPAAGDQPNAASSGAVNRGQVTVAVLNGTTFTGLARSASDRITKAGFKPGVVTNDTTNQARSATAIFYADGQRQAALDVARIIRIGRDAVQPMDQGTRLLAGEDADVVISVGADQAR